MLVTIESRNADLTHRPDVLRSLAEAAVSLGAPADRLGCQNDLGRPARMKLTREARTRLQAKNDRAVKTCMREVKKRFGSAR